MIGFFSLAFGLAVIFSGAVTGSFEALVAGILLGAMGLVGMFAD